MGHDGRQERRFADAERDDCDYEGAVFRVSRTDVRGERVVNPPCFGRIPDFQQGVRQGDQTRIQMSPAA